MAVHRDGREFPVELTISSIFSEGTYTFSAFVHDISERKRAEEKLRAFATELERSNRELQDFASVASHDLQEPLRKIQAFGDLLKAKCGAALGNEGREYLDRMQDAARRNQTLINDLLTLARITTRAQAFVPVDLRAVAEAVLSDLEVRNAQLGARVALGAMPTIEADPMQMRQLLQNLVGNALKFHRHAEPPEIKVYSRSLRRDEQQAEPDFQLDGLCQIFVEDNGIGFDEKYLDRIFTPFQRLHGRTEYDGTGMGLAICRRIAERHNGTITARSTPGHGATFIVTLSVKQPKGVETP
jgi:light-regulated signal transduction histidine kinase (bacteriophytochrome)